MGHCMTEPLRIALAGLGTVGGGVIRLLAANGDLIARRAGRRIEIVAVSARDRNKDRGVDLGGFDWVDDTTALAHHDKVDVVVELVGGSDGPALTLARATGRRDVVFLGEEQRQDVVPPPAVQAQLSPAVVVRRLATHVDHRVDRRRPADHPAARILQAAAVQTGHGLGLVHPVGARIADRKQVADRDVEPDPVVVAAGLQHQHAVARVRAEPVGQDAPGRSRADDDDPSIRRSTAAPAWRLRDGLRGIPGTRPRMTAVGVSARLPAMTPNRTLTAFNTATASENRIHADDVASRFGFTGGLVPGVDVFAYMAHAPVALWGRDWLSEGRIRAKFGKPVYDGDETTVTADEQPDGSLALAVSARGLDCASGTAWRTDDAPAPAILPEGDLPRPDERAAASPGSLPVGLVLGTLKELYFADVGLSHLQNTREDPALFDGGNIANPAYMLRRANYVLSQTVRLGPWIHMESD
eukprot:gene30179-40082_t